MRRIIILIISMIACMLPISACASDCGTRTVESLDDGSYFETLIQDVGVSTKVGEEKGGQTTVSKRKTVYYKNSNGTVLWYVRVIGTFTYGNGSSVCNSARVVANSEVEAWRVSNKSASKSNNKASATATGKKYNSGIVVQTLTRTVTLTCSPTGTFS